MTKRGDDALERIAAALERVVALLEKTSRGAVARPPRRSATQHGPAPTCPECGTHPMKLRTRRRDGAPFWGCSVYPECSGIVSVEDEDDDGADGGGWPFDRDDPGPEPW